MTGNHVKKIQAGKYSAKELTRMNIYHDESCALLRRRGDCDCDPVIEIEERKARPAGKINRDK